MCETKDCVFGNNFFGAEPSCAECPLVHRKGALWEKCQTVWQEQLTPMSVFRFVAEIIQHLFYALHRESFQAVSDGFGLCQTGSICAHI